MSFSAFNFSGGAIQGPPGPQGIPGPQGLPGSGGGASQTVSQTNHNFTVGQVLFYNGSAYALAKAIPAMSEVIGIVQAVGDANTFTVLNLGYITGLSGLVAGTTYYLSDTTPGALMAQDTQVVGNVSKPLLYAISTTAGYFFNQRGVVLSNLSANVNLPGVNKIINGDQSVAQRGNGGSAVFQIPAGTTQYGLDRWQVKAGTGTAVTVAQVQGSTPGRFLQQVGRAASNAGTGLIQVGQTLSIDNCVDFAGNPISLQFKAASNASFSALNGALTVKVITGTGSSNVSALSTGFTGATTVYNSTVSLSSALSLYTVNLPALPTNVSQAYFELSYTPTGTAPATTADSFVFTDVQKEVGTVATPFQRKSFAQNLQDCLPYFEKSYPYGTAPQTKNTWQNMVTIATASANSIAINSIWAGFNFKCPKTNLPIVNTYDAVNGLANTGNYYSNSGTGLTLLAQGAVGFTTPANINTDRCAVLNNSGTGTFNTYAYYFHYTADADFV